jgi:hypothetical protein
MSQGSIYKLITPSPDSSWRRTLATISGPLSDLMKAGTPSKSMASASVSMTSMALIRRATPDRQALAGELICPGRQPDTTAIVGRGLYGVGVSEANRVT